MLIKFAGGALVFLSCTLLGYYYSLKESFRSSDLTELKKALLMLKTEIEFSHSLLADAMASIADRLPTALSAFFKMVGDRLRDKTGADTGEIWRETINDKLPATYLKPEDMEALARLGDTLGYLNKKMQADGLDMAVDYINGKLIELNESAGKSRRLYRSVGVISGILIIVVLI